jgi:hypothetical protein|tara:strand:+ start:309 stop:530 length:222 start_codon:yes stop_codon:yes gene_type:complete
MKAGDLIHMPGQTVREGEVPSIGIVIDDVPRKRSSLSKSQGRIGIMWVDNWGKVDYEPKAWLEVLGEAQTLEA